MNNHDKSNLSFIMSINKEEREIWYETLSDDDKEYASELLSIAIAEANLRIAESLDDITDVSQAADVLDQIRLK